MAPACRSRRLFPTLPADRGRVPTPHGLVCLRIAAVGFGEFGDEFRGRADVEDVVIREFLAVQFLEMRSEVAVEFARAGAGFRRSAAEARAEVEPESGECFLFAVEKAATARS